MTLTCNPKYGSSKLSSLGLGSLNLDIYVDGITGVVGGGEVAGMLKRQVQYHDTLECCVQFEVQLVVETM